MTWDQIRLEIEDAGNRTKRPQHDPVRRTKVAAVETITGIPLIVYAADFTDGLRASRNAQGIQIDSQDKTGFLQATSDIESGSLDVLLHSPGGSPTATESIVHLLRSRFDPIRFIVPHTAKSAATMLALSGNEVLLGEAAELGPIDPQLSFVTDQRPVSVPARAAIDQFDRAAAEITTDPNKMRLWLPIIRQFGPAFLEECWKAIELSQSLVSDWLTNYMFQGEPTGADKAQRVAAWLADHNNFNSHSRPVWPEQLVEIEPTMKIRRIADVDPVFEDAVMDVYWAIDVTFAQTDAVKIIEHRAGSAYIQLLRIAAQGAPTPNPPADIPPVSPNREQRRMQDRQSRKR